MRDRAHVRAGAAALVLAAALVAGCSDDEPAAEPEADAPSASASASSTSASPYATASDPPDGPGGPDDPALDVALSEPDEDSVYPDVGDPGVDSLHYDLDLAWTPDTSTLDGVATITLRSTTDSDRLQLDLGAPLEVSAVTLDGVDVPHDHDGDHLVVTAPVTADERYVLEVRYSGTPEPTPAPTTRSDFSTTGWTTTPTGETWTMQEPYGAFTYYPVNDHPSDKALYDIRVTVPSPWMGVANGELVAQTEADGLTTTSWHLAEPAASYLITVATGDYTRTSNTSSSGLEISYWVPTDRPELAPGLTRAAAGLDWLEERLGPYPFDTLGFLLVDSRSGMETQTMVTLGTTNYTTSEPVLVHELAHHWWGDTVTPDDWRDMWMNEGMAMYLQGAWQADQEGRSVDEVMDEWAAFESGMRAESGPPGDYDPEQFGEGNVYYGPALMWHELRQRVGDEKFWEVARAWPEENANESTGRDEFLPWLVERTGVELAFFEDWLLSPTTPERS